MTGRLRYVLAAAFMALFWLLPEADREHVAFLQTRAWLTEDAGPFEKALVDGKLPPLLVTADHQGQQQRWAGEYQRVAREWSRSNGVAIVEDLPAMHLAIISGDQGFRSDFQASGKPGQRKELSTASAPEAGYFPNRWSLLPAFLAIVLAIMTGKVIPALFAGCFAGAWQYRDNLWGGVTLLTPQPMGRRPYGDAPTSGAASH